MKTIGSVHTTFRICFFLFFRNIWSRGEFYQSFLYAPARHWCALSSGHRAMCGNSTERDKILGKFHMIVSQFPWNVTRFRTMRPKRAERFWPKLFRSLSLEGEWTFSVVQCTWPITHTTACEVGWPDGRFVSWLSLRLQLPTHRSRHYLKLLFQWVSAFRWYW